RVPVVQDLGDGRGQRRLPVVDVTDRANVDVRLSPLELRLRHWCPPVDLLIPGPTRRADGQTLPTKVLGRPGRLFAALSPRSPTPSPAPVRQAGRFSCSLTGRLRDDLLRDVLR